MRIVADRLRLSPTDLARHVACRHLTARDLAVAQGQLAPSERTGWLPASMQQRGDAHERAYVEYLTSRYRHVVDLRECRLSAEGFHATREAMARGVDVLLQAPLGGDAWAGRADVLRRVNGASALGAWSYEPLDTKLARETRGSAILQLCTYAGMLASTQGVRPEWMHVVAPGMQGRPFDEHAFRVDDFFAYYSLVRRRLLAFVNEPDATATYPDPTAHCEICHWQIECLRRRRQDDHLSFVANIRALQIAELATWDIATLAALGNALTPFTKKPRRASLDSLEKAQGQARVQLQARTERRLIHEALPVVTGEGLCRLAAPSTGDIFFDLEGDAFVGERGHEFLFGYAYCDDEGEWQYVGRWAFDAEQEKRAFQEFVGFVIERRARHPDLHIYHYAAYEAGAMRRLMGKHAVCEDEIDQMLRGRWFVDLYAVVRQSLRASVERYSIKDLEPFYGFSRRVPLADVGPHLRAIQLQLEMGDTGAPSVDTWAIVEGYNRDDCLSARDLRAWLESMRAEWEAKGVAVPRPPAAADDPPEQLKDQELAVRAVMARLLDGVPADLEQRTTEQQGCWLLAQLLEFHRREDKAVWWEFFRLAELPADEVLDEPSALGGLELVARIGGTKKCPVDRYRFVPQEIARPRGEVRVGVETKIGEVEDVDLDARTIDIKKTAAAAEVHPSAVFFHQRITPRVLQDALLSLGTHVAERGLDGEGPFRALRSLLLNAPPVLSPGAAWVISGESPIERAQRLALALHESVLPVQGPPGSGKTYTGAQMARALVQAGLKVGVTATSHRVIRSLLDAIAGASSIPLMASSASPASIPNVASGFSRTSRPEVVSGFSRTIRCIQKINDAGDPAPNDTITTTDDNAEVLSALQGGEAQVAGGTAWLWARPEFQEAVDVLIVDEAGQMSLANLLAAGQSARSLILLGDPQQLEQPLQGSHPLGTDVSVLQHILGTHQTLPEDRGLFLAETWRLAPPVCAFTSELFYEGRLHAKHGLQHQRLDGPADPVGAGLWVLPVDHAGNQTCSIEEADVVRDLVSRLTSTHAWIDEHGASRRLSLDDVLIVAPYNAQVYAIEERLPGARVGTVDRFQGQEAPVVIYSMATSSPTDAPRGMEFLYSLNRLNVATSRARCACILVASPRLFEPECQTPRQMQLANAFCRYLELARPLIAPSGNVESIPV